MIRINSKHVSILVSLALLCCFLPSCSQNRYSDTLECRQITSSLQQKILSDKEYSEYSQDDVAYILGDASLFDACSIIYSTSGEDMGEVGVLHARPEVSANTLLDRVNGYLQSSKEEKSAFVENYLPYEMQKLDDASARVFGNYVIFTVLEKNTSEAVFDEIERQLSQ